MTFPYSTPRVDQGTAAIARVYDYVLGGGHNFAADREVAEHLLAIVPAYRDFALENRAFLRRSALYMLDAGIDQFLDLGSGLLSVGPAHEIVHAVNPACRVVYVDNDPIVTANVELSVGGDPRIGVIQADVCDVPKVFGHRSLRVLDLHRPVGVLAVAVLHCVVDADDPRRALSEYHDRLAGGSMLAASHGSGDGLDPELITAGKKILADAGITFVDRTRAGFAALLGPWQPTPDGVVRLNRWRPEGTGVAQADALGYAVMATSTGPPVRTAAAATP